MLVIVILLKMKVGNPTHQSLVSLTIDNAVVHSRASRKSNGTDVGNKSETCFVIVKCKNESQVVTQRLMNGDRIQLTSRPEQINDGDGRLNPQRLR